MSSSSASADRAASDRPALRARSDRESIETAPWLARDIDRDARVIRVRRAYRTGRIKTTKTYNSTRAVPLQALAARALDAIPPQTGSALVFPAPHCGHFDLHNCGRFPPSLCRTRTDDPFLTMEQVMDPVEQIPPDELAAEADAVRAARAERDAALTPEERLERVHDLCRQLASIRLVEDAGGPWSSTSRDS